MARLPAEQAVEPAATWRLAKRPRREARAGDGCQPKLAGIGDHVAGGAGRDAHQWIWSRVLTTPTGKPYDKGRLTKAIQARLVEIGQPKSQYTLHGLRKAAAVLLAESGATVEQLISVMGWRTAGQAIYYCREANKKTLNRAAWAFLDKEAA